MKDPSSTAVAPLTEVAVESCTRPEGSIYPEYCRQVRIWSVRIGDEVVAKEIRNGAFAGALRNGIQDGLENGQRAVCPYPDERTVGGMVTFSRAFRKAWKEGHELGMKRRP